VYVPPGLLNVGAATACTCDKEEASPESELEQAYNEKNAISTGKTAKAIFISTNRRIILPPYLSIFNLSFIASVSHGLRKYIALVPDIPLHEMFPQAEALRKVNLHVALPEGFSSLLSFFIFSRALSQRIIEEQELRFATLTLLCPVYGPQ
jgi:hypothetical protein